MTQVAHQTGTYPGLCSMKRLRRDASPSQGYLSQYFGCQIVIFGHHFFFFFTDFCCSLIFPDVHSL